MIGSGVRLLRPAALKPGDTLGIVACSTPISRCPESTVQRAYARLRQRGFTVVEAANCRLSAGHTAGTIRDRLDALHGFFTDPNVDGILSFWGGSQTHQLLDGLDLDLIRKNPKVLIGFSDTTALQLALLHRIGLVSFSGPAGITFGKPSLPRFSWDHFENVVMTPRVPFELGISKTYSDNRWYAETPPRMRFRKNPGWRVFQHGVAQGPIIGGNVGTMLLLAGTPWWPVLKGSVLFIEEDEVETPQTIDRMLTALRHIGAFDQIAGLVIGRFCASVGFSRSDSLEHILRDALRGYAFPVVTGVDFGHTDPLVTLPLGVAVRLETQNHRLVLLESGVRRSRRK